MQAGRLDRFVTIQRKGVSLSDSGEQQETWTTIANGKPASRAPVSGDERFSDPQLTAHEQFEFRIRYEAALADLTPKDRIIYPALSDASPEDAPDLSRVHDVIAVSEIGRREGLKIITVRRADTI